MGPSIGSGNSDINESSGFVIRSLKYDHSVPAGPGCLLIRFLCAACNKNAENPVFQLTGLLECYSPLKFLKVVKSLKTNLFRYYITKITCGCACPFTVFEQEGVIISYLIQQIDSSLKII